jgi:hypothetical protein
MPLILRLLTFCRADCSTGITCVRKLQSTRKFIALAGLLSSILLSGCRLYPAHTATHSYSTVVNVKLSDWQPATNTAGQKGFAVDRTVPELTDEAVDHDGLTVVSRDTSECIEARAPVFNSWIEDPPQTEQ